MNRLRSLVTRAALLLSIPLPFLSAQQREAERHAIPMPAERSRDSYRVYSALMPIGETAQEGWPHKLWLLKDTTVTTIPDDEPCKPSPGFEHSASPKFVKPPLSESPYWIQPSEDRLKDFLEILEDFDSHCHDRIALDADVWTGPVPVRLLNAVEQQEFVSVLGMVVGERPDKYQGAPALFAFSEVYFNAKHTLGLVYATQYCGLQCAEGFWAVVAFENGKWKQLRWITPSWVS